MQQAQQAQEAQQAQQAQQEEPQLCMHGRVVCPVHHEHLYIKRRVKSALRVSFQYLQVEKRKPFTYYLGADWDVVIEHFKQKMHDWNERMASGYRWLRTENMVIDHIRPKQMFLRNTLATRECLCNHYTNLQPLLPEDNTFKGAHWKHDDEVYWTLNIIMKPSSSVYYPQGLMAPSMMRAAEALTKAGAHK